MNNKIAKILIKIKNISYQGISKKQIKLKYNYTILNLMQKLYSEGFILSFTTLNEKFVLIKLRTYNGITLTNNLKMIIKKNNSFSLKHKVLASFIQGFKKEYFISTSKGIESGYICKKLKIGGLPLFSC